MKNQEEEEHPLGCHAILGHVSYDSGWSVVNSFQSMTSRTSLNIRNKYIFFVSIAAHSTLFILSPINTYSLRELNVEYINIKHTHRVTENEQRWLNRLSKCIYRYLHEQLGTETRFQWTRKLLKCLILPTSASGHPVRADVAHTSHFNGITTFLNLHSIDFCQMKMTAN